MQARKLTWCNQRATALSLAAKGSVVAEKRRTRCPLKGRFLIQGTHCSMDKSEHKSKLPSAYLLKHYVPWWHKGKWRYSPTILDLSTRWRWVVSFMPQPLYPQRNCPLVPMGSREKSLTLPRINPGNPGHDQDTDWTASSHGWFQCTSK
jgi:hypothetical protein